MMRAEKGPPEPGEVRGLFFVLLMEGCSVSFGENHLS
ncbi:hypothetical protein Ptc2401_00621 [Prosthecochloris sp. CIB 2401]|nr:hypothetical protein Ptc2401_00621 [Prosthecochloris sp. CIB 2401]